MATHQCTKFSSYLKQSHFNAVKRIVKYLLGMKDKGLILKPDVTKGIECFVNADFAGMLNKKCPKKHKHAVLLNGRAAAAAEYTKRLCVEIFGGVRQQFEED